MINLMENEYNNNLREQSSNKNVLEFAIQLKLLSIPDI